MDIVVAILAKNKEKELPLFLECLLNQTIDKGRISLYIRSNNNTDNTIHILKKWINKHEHKYNGVYDNYSDIDDSLKRLGNHEWNDLRFKILSKIRNDSIKYAMDMNMHYMVIDCDNYIKPTVIQDLLDANLPVVGPFLKLACTTDEYMEDKDYSKVYSNFHLHADENGYCKCGGKHTQLYNDVFERQIKGLIEVDVIHCTYFIRNEVLKYCNYEEDKYKIKINGNDYRYEYVVFSDKLRKVGVKQYLDNREVKGFLTILNEGEDVMIDYKDVLLKN
jgi:hypothetical protein